MGHPLPPATRSLSGRGWTWLLPGVAVAGLLGCQGHGGPGLPPACTGAWLATSSLDGTQLYALVTRRGPFRVMGSNFLPGGTTSVAARSNMYQFAGTFAVDGGVLCSQRATLFAPAGAPLSQAGSTSLPAGFIATLAVAGSVPTLALTPTVNGTRGTLTFTPDAEANIPVPIARLVGSYATAAAGSSSGSAMTATVSAVAGDASTVALQGGDGEGVLRGTLAQIAPGLNAFTAAFRYLPRAPGSAARNYSGLAYLRPGTALGAGADLILMANAGTVGFAGIFSRPSA